MPRGQAPLTPASSTDIVGKERREEVPHDASFALPPSAMANRSARSPTTLKQNGDALGLTEQRASLYSQAKQREKTDSSLYPDGSQDLSLPPPPTRSRKIIQVKPKGSQAKRSKQPEQASLDNAEKTSIEDASSGGKKKATNTTKAGRKIARKTAHSLIERRRRSKMNEEFGTLKDMIPACAGQEMHKLAILQASIEYLRYLEQCVTDLKGNQQRPSATPSSIQQPPSRDTPAMSPPPASVAEQEESDEEMDDAPESALSRVQYLDRNTSVSSISGSTAITSPSFSAQSPEEWRKYRASYQDTVPSTFESVYSERANYTRTSASATASTQTSPMLLPEPHTLDKSSVLDHEASAALLMLNANDRRKGSHERNGSAGYQGDVRKQRGMSVRDLLSN